MAENSSSRIWVYIAIAIIFVLLLIGIAYFFFQYKDVQSLLKSKSSDEASVLTQEIGKFYQLPAEVPQLASVTDKTQLSDDTFFKGAENGDKVLIYQKSKIAILYRPSIKKIISVGPVAIENPVNKEAVITPESVSGGEAKVVLFNGTSSVGLTTDAEKMLLALSSLKITVLDKDNAVKIYDTTTVIDLSGKKKKEAEQIAGVISGKVGPLPTGEEKPKDAEILIILGKDYIK